MIRNYFTAVLLALLSLQAYAHKGVGCWRGKAPVRHSAQARQVGMGQRTHYTGQKRGLVILAEFTDKKFKTGNDREKYQQILNTPGYTTSEGFKGSVADYFRDQSAGLFELTFDVFGPYTAAHSERYYGENDANGDDKLPQELIKEMCIAVDGEVDFNDYDWDGDGEVDEVFVVYAGKGEVDTYQTNLIWPHMWALEEAGTSLTLDDVAINAYACSNELMSNGKLNGIGTFCHEFSHCLGFPDFYDINYSGLYGMGGFDLMADGNYNGNGFCPVGYTAYEKMMCGWQDPIVLGSEDVSVSNLKPMSEHGDTYIIYNEAWPDEYYMIENRQKTGWDSYFIAAGLMITHVDFDQEVWENNIPNTIVTDEEAEEMELSCGNDHQRMTFFHANNKKDSPLLYPYLKRDSLTANSTPAAKLFNPNSLGTMLWQGAIRNITLNTDGTINFSYHAGQTGIVDAIGPATNAPHPAPVYDLQGRRVTDMRRGIYITGGRKIVR